MNSYDNTNGGGTWGGGYYGNGTDVSSMGGGVPSSSMNPSPPPPQQQMHAPGNAGSDLQQSASGGMPGLMAIGPQVNYTAFGTRPQHQPIDFPKHPPSIIINSLDSKR